MTTPVAILRLNALTSYWDEHFEQAFEQFDAITSSTSENECREEHHWRGLSALRIGKYAEAFQSFQVVVSGDGQNLSALLAMALIKASCPHSSVRDGRYALELAMKASQLVGERAWSVSSVSAAAYAELGDFNQACRHCEDALAIAPHELVERFRHRSAQYIRQEPYRMPLDGFDGIVPKKEACRRCGAVAFCHTDRPLCFDCARTELSPASDSE